MEDLRNFLRKQTYHTKGQNNMSIKSVVKRARAYEKEKKGKKSGAILCFTEACEKKPVVKNRILFESFHGKNISDSPLFVLKELLKREDADKFEIFFSTNDINRDGETIRSLGKNIKPVIVDTKEYADILATAQFLINNSSFPLWYIKREEQTYIQTWHGVPLKTLGKRMRLGIESMYNVQHNFLQADYILFPNEFTREAIMRDYNLELLYTGKVVMSGYPRNDIFHDREREQAVKRQYKLEGKKNYAYMPTWRGTSNHSINIEDYEKDIDEILIQLDKSLKDDEMLYVNLHSMVSSRITIDEYSHIRSFPEGVNNYEFLNAMDVLITDYSSVFFDFSITGKPIVLFTYDLEEYKADRGLYIDIEEMPFTRADSVEELIDIIDNGEYPVDEALMKEYKHRFLSYESPYNSAKLLSLLVDRNEEGLEIIDYSVNSSKTWNYKKYDEVPSVAFLDDMCRGIDPDNEILVLPRNGFTEEMSVLLHDKYRDSFNFVFSRNETTSTTKERLLKRKALKKILLKRDEKRIFAGLNVRKANNAICSVNAGSYCTAQPSAELSCDVLIQQKGICISADFSELNEPCAVVLKGSGEVVYARGLNDVEIENGQVYLELRNVLLNETLKKSERLSLHLTDKKDRMPKIVSLKPNSVHRTELCDGLIGTIAYESDEFTEDEKRISRFVDKSDSVQICINVVTNSRTGNLQLVCNHGSADVETIWRSRVKRFNIRKDGRVRIDVELDDMGGEIQGVLLRSRSSDNPEEIPVTYHINSAENKQLIRITFNVKELNIKEFFWDPVIRLTYKGAEREVKLRCHSRKQILGLRIRDPQVRMDDGMSAVFYTTRSGDIAINYRKASEYETALLRLKEFLALFVFYAMYPYWKRKKIWLVYEKFCQLAQDNGYYFFEYCMRNKKNRDNVFYVINKKGKDYSNVEKYGKNVVDFMSFRHLLYLLAASIYVGSDSKSHLYVWRSRPSLIQDKVRRKKVFFLQHGVTAMKRVDPLFGKRGSSPMTYFTTTSGNEQQIVTKYFGYKQSEAPITGFARWDVLEDKQNKNNPQVLVMPTWRAWLEETSEQTFLSSEYFLKYSSLIQSKTLGKLLEDNNIKLVFYIHPKLSEHIRLFTANNPRIELVEQGSRLLNEIMMESSMLITDYSSVAWDMLYMNKPVAFYQFDSDRYLSLTGSYIDFETELPGKICKEEWEVISEIDAACSNNWELSKRASALCEGWYSNKDKNNSKRTFEFLKQKGY